MAIFGSLQHNCVMAFLFVSRAQAVLYIVHVCALFSMTLLPCSSISYLNYTKFIFICLFIYIPYFLLPIWSPILSEYHHTFHGVINAPPWFHQRRTCSWSYNNRIPKSISIFLQYLIYNDGNWFLIDITHVCF